jgi:hypothetical protein
VAFLASFGALAFRVSFEPVYVTQVCRSNMVNQHRRIWSIIHTVVDFYRCHHGTATVLQFDWAGRTTVFIKRSLHAIRRFKRLHRPHSSPTA